MRAYTVHRRHLTKKKHLNTYAKRMKINISICGRENESAYIYLGHLPHTRNKKLSKKLFL